MSLTADQNPTVFHLIHLKGVSIFEQLQLEEKLLREDNRNFCILNEGSSPAIVMGISGKTEELIHSQNALDLGFPVIKRFSGGGAVVIDENTLFVTFLCNKAEMKFPAYPEKIMSWTESLYQKALNTPGFALKENDFVIKEHKCGGNAQYIKKDRWLQHTSFLWDFCPKKMETLLIPRKTPPYRKGRAHTDFLCTLNQHFDSKDTFFNLIKNHLSKEYTLLPFDLLKEPMDTPKSRRQTKFIRLLSKLKI